MRIGRIPGSERGPDDRRRSVSIVASVVVAITIASGCGGIPVDPDTPVARAASFIPFIQPIMELPARNSIPALVRTPGWLPEDLAGHFPHAERLADAAVSHEFSEPATMSGTTLARLLHVSDAQLRDQRLEDDVAAARLEQLDRLITVTVRNSNVEYLDTLTFAAFLFAFAKDGTCKRDPARFILHTGDLLDISITTELIEGLQVFDHVQRRLGCRVSSVAGNHDGTTFGNLPDKATDTRGLGINSSEFVIGHLLVDPDAGFGFRRNEVVRRAIASKKAECRALGSEDICPATRSWRDCSADQLDSIHDRNENRPAGDLLRTSPIAFRELIHVSGWADTYGQQLGYYAFDAHEARVPGSDVRGVRFLVLDTRSRNAAGGDLDPIQLGWLYRELIRARSDDRLVAVAGHHALDHLAGPARRTLTRMLEGFPNVLAYIYGHEHWNEHGRLGTKGPWLIQTGSTTDFPQAARDVTIAADSLGSPSALRVRIGWTFWRPAGDPKTDQGRLLDSLLEASLSDSCKEQSASKWFFQRWFSSTGSQGAPVRGKPNTWRQTHLWPEMVEIDVDLTRPSPQPETIFGTRWWKRIADRRVTLGLDT